MSSVEGTSPGSRAADRRVVRAARRRARARARAASSGVAGDICTPDGSGPLISLDDVTRFFPGPPPVAALRGVDLTVERGDYLAIVGPSGSGKSTMLNTLGLLDRPSTGRFLFEGVDVSQLGDDERAALRSRAIGFVFQSFHLLSTRTVLENVMLAGAYAGAGREQREPLARAALERVGLSHRVDFSPATLSGGERQRVAIARAVCTSPRLLLADEPTGNLDRENSASIMRLFDELGADGLTIVMITHDEAVAASAGRRVRMHDGELSELA
ncbi:ABC transporter ATP-binding protein [Leucobacter triazinivorans]|uniref:ABC transporter ATP-binding protein n=1 Tax=Leucobacter triazinivorans TaxID=1784719 RepID=A0A4P6KCD1_9MICO|nr:ABC transporter ATP-binding protein [Leucobacter triazinivorans]QBE47995.1 ABC transporter ATP-binding protein [Leucobacter triazinivorans]